MSQEMTIVTDDPLVLEPILKSAMEQERKKIQLGLERTRYRLAEFEREYGMSSNEFERRLNNLEIEESVAFSEWRMEVGLLRLLERQLLALANARLN